jgi:hypothetical protein
VSDLAGDTASIVVRRWVPGEAVAEQAASDLRIHLAARLNELSL